MTDMIDVAAVERGLKSVGESDAPIYRAAAKLLHARRARGVVVDVGCGIGRFLEYAGDLASDYVGIDVVRHPRLSPDAAFHRADRRCACALDDGEVPQPDRDVRGAASRRDLHDR